MAKRFEKWTLIIITVLFLVNTLQAAKQPKEKERGKQEASDNGQAVGIRTDRLSKGQLRAWASIQELVFQNDKNGQPQHPTLQKLWQKVHRSGLIVYIELPGADQSESCEVGRLRIEKFDPSGAKHTAVLRLHLSIIDRANVGKNWQRADGFIPFQDLDRKRRYAEVLGHELAHALLTLEDQQYAEACRKLYSETEQLLRKGAASREISNTERQQRMSALAKLISELEKPAEAAEQDIWRELRHSQKSQLFQNE